MNKILPLFYQNFGNRVVAKSPQLAFRLFLAFTEFFHGHVYSKTLCEFCAGNAQDFCCRLPKAWQSHPWEVGVIKLTAKPASVLANKPQMREKTGKNLTHYGIEGIIASAFADLAKMENQGFCPVLKRPIAQPKQNATRQSKKIRRRKSDWLGVVSRGNQSRCAARR